MTNSFSLTIGHGVLVDNLRSYDQSKARDASNDDTKEMMTPLVSKMMIKSRPENASFSSQVHGVKQRQSLSPAEPAQTPGAVVTCTREASGVQSKKTGVSPISKEAKNHDESSARKNSKPGAKELPRDVTPAARASFQVYDFSSMPHRVQLVRSQASAQPILSKHCTVDKKAKTPILLINLSDHSAYKEPQLVSGKRANDGWKNRTMKTPLASKPREEACEESSPVNFFSHPSVFKKRRRQESV